MKTKKAKIKKNIVFWAITSLAFFTSYFLEWINLTNNKQAIFSTHLLVKYIFNVTFLLPIVMLIGNFLKNNKIPYLKANEQLKSFYYPLRNIILLKKCGVLADEEYLTEIKNIFVENTLFQDDIVQLAQYIPLDLAELEKHVSEQINKCRKSTIDDLLSFMLIFCLIVLLVFWAFPTISHFLRSVPNVTSYSLLSAYLSIPASMALYWTFNKKYD